MEKRIRKFNEGIDGPSKNIIEHYFVGQQMEVEGIKRKQGDGKEIIINETGTIESIRRWPDGDVAYEVEFLISLEHSSPYGKKWTTDKNSFNVFHKKDADKIVRVF